MKISPIRVDLVVKGDIQYRQVMALHGCCLGSWHGTILQVNLLPKLKHLDAE